MLLFASCKKIDALKGDQEEFNVAVLGGWDGIEIKGVGSVTYTHDTTSVIRVVTSQKVFDVLKFNVAGNTLYINVKNGYTIDNGDEVKIFISHPFVKRFHISGSGEITANLMSTPVTASEFVISGSGSIYATNIENQGVMDVILSGEGNIALEGNSDMQNILLSGSGTMANFNLFTTETDIRITGSGNIECRASDSLNVDISGQGIVYYKGTPVVNTSISGSGNVVNAN